MKGGRKWRRLHGEELAGKVTFKMYFLINSSSGIINLCR